MEILFSHINQNKNTVTIFKYYLNEVIHKKDNMKQFMGLLRFEKYLNENIYNIIT